MSLNNFKLNISAVKYAIIAAALQPAGREKERERESTALMQLIDKTAGIPLYYPTYLIYSTSLRMQTRLTGVIDQANAMRQTEPLPRPARMPLLLREAFIECITARCKRFVAHTGTA